MGRPEDTVEVKRKLYEKEVKPYKSHGHELIRYHPRSTSDGNILKISQDGSARKLGKSRRLSKSDDKLHVAKRHKEQQQQQQQEKKHQQQEKKHPEKRRGPRKGVATKEERSRGLELYATHLAEQNPNRRKSLESPRRRKSSATGDAATERLLQLQASSQRVVPTTTTTTAGQPGNPTEKTTNAPDSLEEAYAAHKAMHFEDDTTRFLCSPFAFRSRSTWQRRRGRLWRVFFGGATSSATSLVTLRPGCAPAAVRLLDLKEKQLRHLYSAFCKVDVDRSGSISIGEFLASIDEADTAFARVFIDEVVFDFADLDTDNQLTFSEFVVAATAVCSLSRKELLFFLFRIFDVDQSGTIEHREFAKLAQAVHDSGSMFPGSYAQFFAKFDANDDGEIDFSEFLALNDRFPMLFFPASRLQDNFRRTTFTPDLWVRLSRHFSDANRGERFHRRIAAIGRGILSVGGGTDNNAGHHAYGGLDDEAHLGGSFHVATSGHDTNDDDDDKAPS